MVRCWCHAAMSAWQGWSVGGSRVSPEASFRWRAECERAGGDCAARVEAVALRMPWTRAVRRGESLELFTHGHTLHFQDSEEQSFRYLGPMLDEDHHVLWQRTRDGQRFIVVSGSKGRTGGDFPSLEALLAQAGETSAVAPAPH